MTSHEHEAFANNLLDAIARRRAADGEQPKKNVAGALKPPPSPVRPKKGTDIERRMRTVLEELRKQD